MNFLKKGEKYYFSNVHIEKIRNEFVLMETKKSFEKHRHSGLTLRIAR